MSETWKISSIQLHLQQSCCTLELLDFFSRCDLTCYLGLYIHLTITLFSYSVSYTCFGTAWPFWCRCAVKLWYHHHLLQKKRKKYLFAQPTQPWMQHLASESWRHGVYWCEAIFASGKPFRCMLGFRDGNMAISRWLVVFREIQNQVYPHEWCSLMDAQLGIPSLVWTTA